MHSKLAVVDGTAVWTESRHFTTNDTYRYSYDAILIQSSASAKNSTATFENRFKDDNFGLQRKPGGMTPTLTIGGVTVNNYFAPQEKNAGKIGARRTNAEKIIGFTAHSSTDGDIGNVAIART